MPKQKDINKEEYVEFFKVILKDKINYNDILNMFSTNTEKISLTHLIEKSCKIHSQVHKLTFAKIQRKYKL